MEAFDGRIQCVLGEGLPLRIGEPIRRNMPTPTSTRGKPTCINLNKSVNLISRMSVAVWPVLMVQKCGGPKSPHPEKGRQL